MMSKELLINKILIEMYETKSYNSNLNCQGCTA